MTFRELEVRVVAAQVDDPPHCFTCSRPLARFAGPGPESGWTCVTCDDPTVLPEHEPVEVCSCEEALALRAEVERLRAELARVMGLARATAECADKLRGKLADAHRLLVRLRKSTWQTSDVALPLDVKAHVNDHDIARQAFEQAVLDASHLILDSSLRRIREVEGGCLGDWAAAELARREAKR